MLLSMSFLLIVDVFYLFICNLFENLNNQKYIVPIYVQYNYMLINEQINMHGLLDNDNV